MTPRLPPWDATGLVEKAWKRLDPPTRDELAHRLGLKAATNISKLNKGKLPMTVDYAERICRAVPGLTLADLGAPEPVVAELEPLTLARLQALEAQAIGARSVLLGLLAALEAHGIQVPLDQEAAEFLATRGSPDQAGTGTG